MKRGYEKQVLVLVEKDLPRNRNAPTVPNFTHCVWGLEKAFSGLLRQRLSLAFTPDFGGKNLSSESGTNSSCLTKLQGFSGPN